MKRLAAFAGILLITLLLSTPFRAPLLGFTSSSSFTSASANAVSEEEEHEGESNLDFIFKIVNFAILVGGLGYLLRKPLADFFAERTATIRKELEEGRKALETSNSRLKSVEEKIDGLEQHIATLKETAEKEEEAERVRLKEAARREAERIAEAARNEIGSATRVAKLELKSFAAQQAIRVAEEILRNRKDKKQLASLVNGFVEEIKEARKA